MPNAIKYNTSAETLALKKGNFWIGTGDVGKGPTSSTGFYNGITPPTGGYTIYLNKASGGPSIYTVSTVAQLTGLTSSIAGQTLTTSGECLNWFATQTDKMIFNIDYPAIVTSGLTLNLDAGFTPSYPTTATTWYDVSSSVNNGTLINGPTYSGGSIVFDGVDDYITIPDSLAPTPAVTMIFWINKTFTNYYLSVLSRNNNAVNGSPTGVGYGTPISSSGWIQLGYMGDGTNNYFIINGVIYSENAGGQFPYDFANSIVMFSMNNNGYFSNNNAPVTSFALTTSAGGYSGYQWLNRNYKVLGILSTSGNRMPFDGKMSNSLFYNRVLSASEVSQNYTVTKSNFFLESQILVVAGGGGGGKGDGSNRGAGGGGAGGLQYFSANTTFVKNTNYTITIGAGGPNGPNFGSFGSNGNNSIFGSLTSYGGGGGSGAQPLSTNGFSGGSGGGGAPWGSYQATSPVGVGGSGVSGQGFSGGSICCSGDAIVAIGTYGAGGGGAGSVGGNGGYRSGLVGNPGSGVTYNVLGVNTLYSQGGRGGGFTENYNGDNGLTNRGYGGGGTRAGTAGSGGSGIIVFTLPYNVTVTFSNGVTWSSSTSNFITTYVVTATSTTSETVSFS